MKNNKKHFSNRHGLAVISVVMIVAIIGVTGAVFFLSSKRTSLKETTSQVQKKQSTTCAESSIDIAIQCIKDQILVNNWSNVKSVCIQNTLKPIDAVSIGACDYSYELEEITDVVEIFGLDRDTSEIVLLNPTESTNINVKWVPDDSTGNVLEFNLMQDNATDITMSQIDYSCTPSGGAAFDDGLGDGYELVTINNNICEATINVAGNDFVQITPRHSGVTDLLVTIQGNNAPLQGYKINGKGMSGETLIEIEAHYLYSDKYGLARLFNNSIFAQDVQ